MDKYYTWFREYNGWHHLKNSEVSDLFWLYVVLILAYSTLVVVALFLIADQSTGKVTYFYGYIIDKDTSHIIIREDITNKVIKLKAPIQTIYDSKPGQRIEFSRKYGGITKKELSTQLS
jgi:hypothetical protein